jgi:hypothetical protein
MLFNSFVYLLLFLPIVATGFGLLQKYRGPQWAQGFLLAASLYFYWWAAPRYVPLLAGSILFN